MNARTVYADGKTAQVDVCVSLPHVTNVIALLSNGGWNTSHLLLIRENPTVDIDWYVYASEREPIKQLHTWSAFVLSCPIPSYFQMLN